MIPLIALSIGAVVGFCAGLLVGKKNPSVADDMQSAADKLAKK